MNVHLFAVLTLAAISVAAYETTLWFHWNTKWLARGYTNTATKKQALIRILSATVAAGAAFKFAGTTPMVIAAATAGWLAALAWTTDVRNTKIPSEPCYLVFATGTVCGIAQYSQARAASAIVAFLAIATMMVATAFLTRGALGSGDVRLMVAFTPLAWLIGYTPFLIGIFLGCIIQMFLWFTAYRGPKENPRPFAPALITGFILATTFFVNETTYCAEWVNVFQCGP